MTIVILTLLLLNIIFGIIAYYYTLVNQNIINKILFISQEHKIKINLQLINIGDVSQELLDDLRMKRDSIMRISRNRNKMPLKELTKRLNNFQEYLKNNPQEDGFPQLTLSKLNELNEKYPNIRNREDFLYNQIDFFKKCNNEESKINEALIFLGYNLMYIKNPTKKMIVSAIKNNYRNIAFVEKLTPEIIEACVIENPSVIEYIPNLDPKLAEYAVTQNPVLLDHVQNQTVDLCLKALSHNKNAYLYVKLVPNDTYEITIKNLLKRQQIVKNLK